MKFNSKYNLYVSKDGLCFKVKNDKLVYLKPHTQNGYERLWCGLVHRIVYETYVGEITDGMQIDHINDIRNDNRVENLQALTPLENLRKAHLGKKKSEETRRKMSEYQRGSKHPWTTINNKTRTFKQSDESKKKIGESMRKYWEEKRKCRKQD